MYKGAQYYANLKKYKDAEIKTITEKVFVGKNIIIPTDKFSSFDFIYEDKKCIVELKNRNFTSDFFDDKYEGVMMLEKSKSDRLLNLVKKGGEYEGYLVCFMYYFTDDVFQYVILNKLDFDKCNIEETYCPKNSCDEKPKYANKTTYKIQKELLNKNNFVRRKLTL